MIILGADKGADADEELNSFIVDIANNPEYHRLVLRNPRQLLLYSAPLAYGIVTKQATPATFRCVDKVLTFPQVLGVERSSHRLMDLWQFLTLIHRHPDWLIERDEWLLDETVTPLFATTIWTSSNGERSSRYSIIMKYRKPLRLSIR